MTIEEWKELFVNIGYAIVGLVLAFGQVYTIFKLKKQSKDADKEKTKNTNYGEAIKHENKYTLQIQKEIEELRQMVTADRVQVLEFHNGTDFSTRKGYKLDCTYETLKYGNEPVKGVLQNYPTTMLPIFMNRIIEDKKYFVPNIQQLVEKDMSTYAMKLNMHVGAFYDVCLEDSNGMPIGILAVQFANPTELNTDDLAAIEGKKIIVQQLLKG